jgi:predicted kinase
LLHCHASPETLRQRLETRQGDASDADWAISRQMADSWEEFGPITRRLAYDLRTEGTPEEAQQQALEALRQWGLWD